MLPVLQFKICSNTRYCCCYLSPLSVNRFFYEKKSLNEEEGFADCYC